MNVLGYDPHITVEAAWSLPSQVKRAHSVDEVLKASHFVTLHVPLVEKTRHLVNAKNIELMQPRRGAAQLLARRRRRRRRGAEAALDERPAQVVRLRLSRAPRCSAHPGVIALPHLGASTARGRGQLRRDGGRPAARLPRARQPAERGQLPRRGDGARGALPRWRSPTPTCPTCSGSISHALGKRKINIHNMLNKSKGEMAYTLVDTDTPGAGRGDRRARRTLQRRARGALSARMLDALDDATRQAAPARSTALDDELLTLIKRRAGARAAASAR